MIVAGAVGVSFSLFLYSQTHFLLVISSTPHNRPPHNPLDVIEHVKADGDIHHQGYYLLVAAEAEARALEKNRSFG